MCYKPGPNNISMTLIKRIIKSGLISFHRNIGLNLATIFIMVMVIAIITFLYFLGPVSRVLIGDIQKKVDVSVYFKEEALEEDIFVVKAEIGKISQVKTAEYVSKEEALNIFLEKHKDDPVLIESLTEIGQNPFLASLNIKAQEPSQYEQIVNFLETGEYSKLVEEVDYYQRKPIIDKVFATTTGVRGIGIFLGLIFALIAVIIAFNAVKIAIHNRSEEISAMCLIGASNKFIKGPFLVQGIAVGAIAALVAFLLSFIIFWGVNSKVASVIPGLNIFGIFLSNIFWLLLIQFGTGIGLGAVSSLIAVRKYLKI